MAAPRHSLRILQSHAFGIIPSAAQAAPASERHPRSSVFEKLARILRGRGVTLTATAMAAGLATELVKAAPATLLHSATTAVLSGSATAQLGKHFATWARKDLSAAKAWFDERANSGEDSTTPGNHKNEFLSPLVAALITARTPDLRAFLLGLPKNDRTSSVVDSMRGVVRGGMRVPTQESERTGPELGTYLPVIREHLAEKDRERALKEIGINLSSQLMLDTRRRRSFSIQRP